VLNDPAAQVTRFIGLGRVGNAEKRKWLYAFNIAPMKDMERAAIAAQPLEVTDAPFTMATIMAQVSISYFLHFSSAVNFFAAIYRVVGTRIGAASSGT
jgi:hypothetical protein